MALNLDYESQRMEYENQRMEYEDTDVKHERTYLSRLTSVSWGAILLLQ